MAHSSSGLPKKALQTRSLNPSKNTKSLESLLDSGLCLSSHLQNPALSAKHRGSIHSCFRGMSQRLIHAAAKLGKACCLPSLQFPSQTSCLHPSLPDCVLLPPSIMDPVPMYSPLVTLYMLGSPRAKTTDQFPSPLPNPPSWGS